jgi:hypothetical protein
MSGIRGRMACLKINTAHLTVNRIVSENLNPKTASLCLGLTADAIQPTTFFEKSEKENDKKRTSKGRKRIQNVGY